MRACFAVATFSAALVFALFSVRHTWRKPPGSKAPSSQPASTDASSPTQTYLGFDRNDYPGDSALANLKSEFSFASYWLNAPPGETSDSWLGKRAVLQAQGLGFLVVFNGRLDKQLKSSAKAAELGKSDAAAAVAAALREGFPKGTTIFLDQEEGGRLLPEQNAYLFAWLDAVIASGFKAGVYCSGIPAPDGPGQFIVTANDIKRHQGDRSIAFFVYNDACPPSPGCARAASPPPPSGSGIPFASVWQFSQSPRRPEYSQACASTYAKDGNCYPSPQTGAGSIHLDFDSALWADPSNGRN
jgi:hypothetical protein